MDQLIDKFDFSHCSKAGAKFDYEKGRWFNHEYLQMLSDESLARLFKPVLCQHGVNADDYSDEFLAHVVGLVKGRIYFVKDLWEQTKFFFVAPDEYSAKDVKKRWNEDTPRIMGELIEVLLALPDFGSKAAEPVVLDWIASKGYHLGNVMNAFRLTVVGECKGPHMFDITELLGKDETVARIKKGVERIKI